MAYFKTGQFLSVLGLIILFSTKAWAQKEGNFWAFGYQAGLNFNTVSPTVVNTSITSLEGTASIADANGNLLFYTNGARVWNKNHVQMPLGGGLSGDENSSAAQGPLIIKDLANSKRYYIFVTTQNENLPDLYLRYSIVDMSLDGGLGDLVVRNVIIDSSVAEMLTGAGSGTCDRWLISHQHGKPEFHAFHITSSGISAPVVSTAGLPAEYSIGMIKASNNGKMIACLAGNVGVWMAGTNSVQLFDFDINTGIVSNARLVLKGKQTPIVDQLYGLAFSPDDNKLYINSTLPNSILYIYQSDISNPSLPTTSAPMTAGMPGNVTDIKCGPDGKLYFRSSDTSLGIIPRPNLDAPFCGLIPDAIHLSPGRMISGFPNAIVQTNNNLKHNIIACSKPYIIKAQPGATSYLWNNGSVDSFIYSNNDSIYWLTTTMPCGIKTDTFAVTFKDFSVDMHDTAVCNGQLVSLNPALNGNYQYQWQDGDTAAIYTATETGKYYVTITNGSCTVADTAQVTIYPPLSTPLLPPDTVLCEQSFPFTITASPLFQNYTWGGTAATGRNFIADSPGKYWVSAPTMCGIYSDTIDIRGCMPGSAGIAVNTDTICENHCIHFSVDSASNITSFQWSFPGGTPDSFSGPNPPDICYISPGDYTIHLIAANAFSTLSYDTLLHILRAPIPRFIDTVITASYRSFVQLPACYPAQKTEWYKNDSLICTGCNPLTVQAVDWRANYTCVLHNATCREECHYQVTATGIPADAWLPSVFSPNGDGKNDYFRLITDNPNIALVELSIYDRWGERLFHAQQNGTGWNGRYNGKEVEQGTYFWYLRYKVEGQSQLYVTKGEVSLVR